MYNAMDRNRQQRHEEQRDYQGKIAKNTLYMIDEIKLYSIDHKYIYIHLARDNPKE
jgi:hypothetical protein